MTVQLRFPTDLILPASYHIHEKPVNPRDPAGPCSPSSTGGIFAGSDLGTLFENINGPSPYSPGTLYDFSRQLQLNGDTSIVGRAIVIHNGPIPVACATIVGQPRIEAQSTFNSNQVVGFIRCGLTSFRPPVARRPLRTPSALSLRESPRHFGPSTDAVPRALLRADAAASVRTCCASCAGASPRIARPCIGDVVRDGVAALKSMHPGCPHPSSSTSPGRLARAGTASPAGCKAHACLNRVGGGRACASDAPLCPLPCRPRTHRHPVDARLPTGPDRSATDSAAALMRALLTGVPPAGTSARTTCTFTRCRRTCRPRSSARRRSVGRPAGLSPKSAHAIATLAACAAHAASAPSAIARTSAARHTRCECAAEPAQWMRQCHAAHAAVAAGWRSSVPLGAKRKWRSVCTGRGRPLQPAECEPHRLQGRSIRAVRGRSGRAHRCG